MLMTIVQYFLSQLYRFTFLKLVKLDRNLTLVPQQIMIRILTMLKDTESQMATLDNFFESERGL